MKKFFKQIPNNKSKPLSQYEKHQVLLADIGGEWYMKQMGNNLPPLRKQNISKKSQERGTYRLSVGIGMIGNYRYIGTCFSGLIQEVE